RVDPERDIHFVSDISTFQYDPSTLARRGRRKRATFAPLRLLHGHRGWDCKMRRAGDLTPRSVHHAAGTGELGADRAPPNHPPQAHSTAGSDPFRTRSRLRPFVDESSNLSLNTLRGLRASTTKYFCFKPQK